MKLYKKALVASAIIGSFAAQAVTIAPSTKIELSAEGVALGVAATPSIIDFDIVVEKPHPATTVITLTFDKSVDLNGLEGDVCAPNPGGSGNSDTCGDVTFSYGNGNFTFDNVVVTEAASATDVDVITFEVSTGNAITAFSSFGVTLGQTGTPKVKISGATEVEYVSEYNMTEVESDTFSLASEKSQFSFDLTTPLNGVIEREAQETFVNGSGTDTLAFTVVNDESLTLLVPAAEVVVEVAGNFTDVDKFDSASAAVGTLTLTDTAVSSSYTGAGGTTKMTTAEVWSFEGPSSTTIPVTGSTVLKATLVGTSDAAVQTKLTTTPYAIATDVDAGEWTLDAVTLNVPYFPINYADTQSSVHIANEGDKDADIIVTAIDNNGVEYGPTNLGYKAEGNTVTKVSQTTIATLFDITDATKLSVTFNIEAEEENISAYASTQNAKGKSEVSNSQYKGKK